jgi:CDP-6-deoxy-D-xylo-4-hexulose-3-dehydrase
MTIQKKNKIIKVLRRKKISNRLLFGENITKLLYMKNVNYKSHGRLSNTNKIMNSTYWLGIHPRIEDDYINYMFENTKFFFKK